MREGLLKYFCCPGCRNPLSINVDRSERCGSQRIKIGGVRCAQCHKTFPIINYIPRFVEQANYCDSFGFQWNRHRSVQIDKYNGYSFSRERLFSVTQWPARLEGEYILEVGSGAGRFTQVLIETGANIFSFDYSSAVDANLANNGTPQNLLLFQADLHHLPLVYELFDKIICLGVLQHTPAPEKAFEALVPFLKRGGEIVIDVYKKTLCARLQWKYLLRPVLRHVRQEVLYNCVRTIVPCLLPLAVLLRRIGGPIGNRILPIANYSHLGIPYMVNKELSILDTFDMYSPQFDHPQTLHQVRSWFQKMQLEYVEVHYGPNGIIGRGIKAY